MANSAQNYFTTLSTIMISLTRLTMGITAQETNVSHSIDQSGIDVNRDENADAALRPSASIDIRELHTQHCRLAAAQPMDCGLLALGCVGNRK